MTYKLSNTPAPDDLLSTAREALKSILREPDVDHSYTILMAMNAMGIAARAMQAGEPLPAHSDMGDEAFKRWVRQADEGAITDPGLTAGLRRHVEYKLGISNPRFQAASTPARSTYAESTKDRP
ncbi:MAG: hypothetical protein WAL83_03510 [Arenicellales bacterium]|jgi:hypothetical protein